MVTQERVKELFEYDRDTGKFYHKYSRGPAKKGSQAGYYRKDGYLILWADKKQYLGHRLAWLYEHGSAPAFIDHIDHDPSNNAIRNLRAVTHQENLKNCKLSKNNKTGTTGVTWRKAINKWGAYVHLKGKQQHLGTFKDKELAELVSTEARVKYNFHENHGV